MSPAHTVLTAINRDERDVSIDCLFEGAPHLEVGTAGATLAPGEPLNVPIVFKPLKAVTYRDVVPFEISGLYTVQVAVTGEGTPLRVELANPAHATMTFGALRSGQMVQKDVRIVNRSKLPV